MDIQIIAIKALQLLACLSLLVVLHEGGHFFFSKLFGVRVEKFYMFFNPYFHLFSTRDKWFTRLFPRFKKNETEYGIGWLPFGGYVKIAGMVDESMDTEQLQHPAKPDEFRSQPIWKRFFIMVGGVLVNLITAFVLYSIIMFTWGKDMLPMQNIKNGFVFNAQAEQLGFRNGDIPIRVDGEEIEGYSRMLIRDFSNAKIITVLRNGNEVVINMPENGLNMLEVAEMKPAFFDILAPAQIDSVVPATPAAHAGMVRGSYITSIDGQPIRYWSDFDSLMNGRTERDMLLTILKPNAVTPDTLQLTLREDMTMGVIRKSPITEDMYLHVEYDFWNSIPAGIKAGWQQLAGYVNDLKYIFSPKGAQSVGSFITIGSIFPNVWNWEMFWNLTAFISIILAVMNILPIPGLDGGHIMILAYEAITGHQPSERIMVWLEYIGMGFLIALMVLALGNDFIRWILPNI